LADARTFQRRLDDQRQAEVGHYFIEIGALVDDGVLRRRDAVRQPHDLGGDLVHADRRRHHAAAGVRDAELLEGALQAAVFAVAAVQRDEDAVEFFGGQVGQRAFGRVERMGVDALGLQGLQHAGAGQDRDLALGGTAAEQDADLAQFLDFRRSKSAHDATF
jgi:hypothetical protein